MATKSLSKFVIGSSGGIMLSVPRRLLVAIDKTLSMLPQASFAPLPEPFQAQKHSIYQDGHIILLEKIPHVKQSRVIVTVLEEWTMSDVDQNANQTSSWLGTLADTAQIAGDLVQPLEDALADW